MAGSGPPPNPNARRRNDRQSGFEVLPAEGREPPPLPGPGWSKAGRAAWETWWRSPMGGKWTDHDVPQVVLMCRCYQRAMAGNVAAAPEFRQWADRFGLAPLARLKNRWVLPGDQEPESRASKADANVIRLVSG